MNLLDTLTRVADEEQLRLRPLPDHAAATQAEHLRRHYALLLAAVLTAQPTVSEPQTRLLRLLLDALKLGDIRGTLFEQARELTPEPLLEAARLIREAGFAHHLLLDALVLLRLDAPLSDEAARLAGELAAFLGLDENQLATRAVDVSEILGLNATKPSNDNAEDPATERPLLLAELWPSRLHQPLTSEALRAGLQGGLWLLDTNLDVDFPWQANDAILLFRNSAILNTFAKEGEVNLTGCRLVDAVLDFQGACSITLERCDWQGDYDPVAKHTALNSNGQALTVTNCDFSTRNARSIMVINTYLSLEDTNFKRCGHTELNGGAVFHSTSSYRGEIKNCHFYSCLAARGGALFVNELNGISQSEFVSCESRALQDQSAGDVAVYADKTTLKSLSDCTFRKTSIVIGKVDGGIYKIYVESTQFHQANLYFNFKNSESYNYSISSGCSFIDGREINKNIYLILNN